MLVNIRAYTPRPVTDARLEKSTDDCNATRPSSVLDIL